MIYWIMCYYMLLLFLLMFLLFLYFYIWKILIFYEFMLFSIVSLKFELLILMDWMMLLFISVVLLISIMVLIYSMEYMLSDLNMNRFMWLILMFVFSMILMIMSPNMVSILIGWDGLGLVSYCLVIFFQSETSFNSGMVTVLSNRIGDIMILLLVSLLMMSGSWNIMFMSNLSMYGMLMILIASFTKSAQIPFSTWLPMAMAAPTPVSSLVHSSTLVTAGVYLLIRFNYLMKENVLMMMILLIFSSLTMFMSGLGANFEFDLKKIIALSTLSQLGVMIFCLSMGFSKISFFHLLTHAMFKSMLFMCAGVIIHNMMGFQDIRFISMISWNFPLVSVMFNCASLSLCGMPFLSGFFSKDLILEMFLMGKFNQILMGLIFFSMGLTVMYSLRLMYYSFVKNTQFLLFNNYYSFGGGMIKSMIILFFMTIIFGLNLNWILFTGESMIFLEFKFKFLIYKFMLMGMILGGVIIKLKLSMKILLYMNLYMNFFFMMWFLPLVYGVNIFKILNFSSKVIYNMELGWNEKLLGMNLIFLLKKMLNYEIGVKNYFLVLVFISYIILMFF